MANSKTNDLTEVIYVRCTPEMKARIEQSALVTQRDMSTFIRLVLETFFREVDAGHRAISDGFGPPIQSKEDREVGGNRDARRTA